MLVQVSGKGFELSTELREYVEEKLNRALERFRPRIARVNAFLSDENGPKNGLDKSLRIVIDMDQLPLTVVEERGEMWHAILDQTAKRAVHSVSRQVERARAVNDRTSMAGDADTSLGTGSE